MVPTNAKLTRVTAAPAALNRALRKKRRSSMGWVLRASQKTKPASSSTPPADAPTVAGLPQPLARASMIAYSSPTRPAVDSTAPAGSGRGADGSLEAGTMAQAAASAIAARGTLIRNIEPHQNWPSSQPPRVGPTAGASAPAAAQIPIALGRSASGNTLVKTNRVAGSTNAAPRPSSPRAAMSTIAEGEYAHSAEPSPNITRPSMSVLFRPKRSPRLRAVSSKPANTSE